VQQKSPTADAEGLFDHQVEQRGGKSKHFEEDLKSTIKHFDVSE